MANESEQSFDEARDRLYSAEPDEFIAERGRLAKLLRADGQPAVAADVQKLRRPSVAAWSINQAARADRHRVAELFAAGEALGQAHHEASSGRAGTNVRDAARRRRALVDELTGRAMSFATSLTPNPATHRDAIEATWEAASIEPEVQPIVAAGWLPKELPRPSGFGLGASEPSMAKRATSKRATASSPSRSAPPRDELALRRAQAALAGARREFEEAEDEVARADRDATAAQEAHDDAARRVADLEAALTAARAEAREAAREAKAAEQAGARARASRDRARRKVDKAARALADREQ